MNSMKNTKRKTLIFIALFSFLGLITLHIPVSHIVGSNQTFSVFDFFAPTIGLIINNLPGAISVFFVKFFDMIFVKKTVDIVSVIRLLPLPLAAFYFGSQSKYKSLIAFLCIVLFILHPVGKQAWAYSLYFVIPIVAAFFPKRLFLKSLGSTFTAHAVGSVVFLYTFQLTPAIWLGLIPVVFIERISFALGIYASYFLFNLSLYYLVKLSKRASFASLVNTRYLPSKKFFLQYS